LQRRFNEFNYAGGIIMSDILELEIPKKKKPRKPLSEENKPGRYDERNTLNDLTGKEWLLLTCSFWTTEPSNDDKPAYAHPAPFMIRDVEKLISLFTKKGMTVLDPFVGSGTTLVAANKIGRKGIGIDLNPKYKELTEKRMTRFGYKDYEYIVGDSNLELEKIDTVDYIVTSPPYHNILKNDSKGVRHNSGKLYRMAAREGVEFYSEFENDLGNFDEYTEFISALKEIMSKAFLKLHNGRYCTIIISDFTVNKIEICVQADVVRMMQDIGFEFCGTTVLLQPVKPLFPFGYPYAYKINHHHQNIMNFRKPKNGLEVLK
jgi:DNA modification methylase